MAVGGSIPSLAISQGGADMLDPRQEIIALVSKGYQARNGIESQVADYHAERLMEEFERSRICSQCGSVIEDAAIEKAIPVSS
jgi:hypothetical protein